MLEIGCGDGGNIIPIAAANPGSRFMGIDLSGELIERGTRDIAALGLHNIELVACDVGNFSVSSQSFDYIVCHGVFSWVAPETQDAILGVIQRGLRPQGVALVSYNTFPGWEKRKIIREILRVGAQGSIDDSDQGRYEAAMNHLRVVAESNAAEYDNPQYIREAYARLCQSEPSYILEEYLGVHNTPLLFRDFARLVETKRLQYLSECKVVMMSPDGLSESIQITLQGLQHDRIAYEQELDIARNRSFRETLVCRSDIALERGLRSSAFKDLYLIALYTPVVRGGTPVAHTGVFREIATGRELQTPAGECSDVLALVASFKAQGARVADIFDRSRGLIEYSERDMISILVTLWRSGFIELLSEPVCGRVDSSDKPRAAPWLHQEIETRKCATSALHESYSLTGLEQSILQRCDGSVTVSQLIEQASRDGSREMLSHLVDSLEERGFFQL